MRELHATVTVVSTLSLMVALVSLAYEIVFLLDAVESLHRDWQALTLLRF